MTFNQEGVTNTEAQQGQPNQATASHDQGSGTGEGMDIKTFEELQKRDEHAQKHISNLEGENAGMREDYTKLSAELQELKEKLAAQERVDTLLKGNQSSAQDRQEDKKDEASAFDPSHLDSLVSEKLKSHFTEVEQSSNFKRASDALNNLFKDKADEHVTKVAADNGMTMDDAVSLSRTNPRMFENVFIKPFGQAKGTTSTSYTGQNTGSVPSGQQQITQEYWNEMRRNPKTRDKYWSVPVQKQYHAWVHSQSK